MILVRLLALLSFLIILVLLYANWPDRSLSKNIRIDKIILYKSKHQMILVKEGETVKEYRVALGKNPVGHKMQQGDNRTPEGVYLIDYKNPKSRFLFALHISYPDDNDKRIADQKKLNPGGEILIHGLKKGLGFIGRLHRFYDWTGGCIAVTNSEIEEIYRVTPVGTIVEIKP
ncbi:L,D-transpeptidase family protein [candidate division KSB1 bacterium]|nr:L,D-transpeptidase family protein [candidate division KSB1 bacterium]